VNLHTAHDFSSLSQKVEFVTIEVSLYFDGSLPGPRSRNQQWLNLPIASGASVAPFAYFTERFDRKTAGMKGARNTESPFAVP
jgi:hypothetical protein